MTMNKLRFTIPLLSYSLFFIVIGVGSSFFIAQKAYSSYSPKSCITYDVRSPENKAKAQLFMYFDTVLNDIEKQNVYEDELCAMAEASKGWFVELADEIAVQPTLALATESLHGFLFGNGEYFYAIRDAIAKSPIISSKKAANVIKILSAAKEASDKRNLRLFHLQTVVLNYRISVYKDTSYQYTQKFCVKYNYWLGKESAYQSDKKGICKK